MTKEGKRKPGPEHIMFGFAFSLAVAIHEGLQLPVCFVFILILKFFECSSVLRFYHLMARKPSISLHISLIFSQSEKRRLTVFHCMTNVE